MSAAPSVLNYFSERKTRSQKCPGKDATKQNTPTKTGNRKTKDLQHECKQTSPKSSRDLKITGQAENEVIHLNLNDTSSDNVSELQPKTPSKRKNNKSTKEPCSPPKVKCNESSNDLPKTPSTLISCLTLSSPASERKRRTSVASKSLFPEPVDVLSKARNALHTHCNTSLPGRELELEELNIFIQNHYKEKSSGSLYISGPPGTGKTACLTQVLDQPKLKVEFKIIFINCASIKTPEAIYSRIACQLNLQMRSKTEKAYCKAIEKHLQSNHKMILLVLDEMDELDTSSHSVLYTIFEWPFKYSSGIILIGIANALDFTDRLLPRLKAELNLAPKLLHFSPYTREQLSNILKKRLEEADACSVFRPAALQFLASKLSAVNGDARRTLDTARRAVEVFDEKINSTNSQTPLIIQMNTVIDTTPVRTSPRKAVAPQQTEKEKTQNAVLCERMKSPLRVAYQTPSKSPFKSPVNSLAKSPFKSPPRHHGSQLKENCSPVKPRSAKKSLTFCDEGVKPMEDIPQAEKPCIDVASVMNVLNDVYGTTQVLGRAADGGEELPLHQKLALCSLLLILRAGKNKDVTVGKLHDVYRRVCTKRHMEPLDSSAFLSMLGLIEARGILLLPGRGKIKSRLTKVCMQWIEDEVVSALKDKDLLAKIINDKACLSQ